MSRRARWIVAALVLLLAMGAVVRTLMARKAVALGGTITGEHGVGKMKREHLALQYPPGVIAAMKAVKRSFDPKGILAPGNIFIADHHS